jgi:hypothetical protein
MSPGKAKSGTTVNFPEGVLRTNLSKGVFTDKRLRRSHTDDIKLTSFFIFFTFSFLLVVCNIILFE